MEQGINCNLILLTFKPSPPLKSYIASRVPPGQISAVYRAILLAFIP